MLQTKVVDGWSEKRLTPNGRLEKRTLVRAGCSRWVSLRLRPTGSERRSAGGVTPKLPSLYRAMAGGSARSCALRGGIHGVKRLASGHEQAVALGAAEANVAAHLGQADPADELAV